MNIKIFILISMIFFHIIDDYYLQGCLASMKQKHWWKQFVLYEKCKYDYIMALFCHAFSWSFSIQIPILIYSIYMNNFIWNTPLFIFNILIHMGVDDLKANQLKINLIQDQLLHLCQIFVTWLLIIIL